MADEIVAGATPPMRPLTHALVSAGRKPLAVVDFVREPPVYGDCPRGNNLLKDERCHPHNFA